MNLVDWWTDTIEPLMDEGQERKALEAVLETVYSSKECIPDIDKLMAELIARERFDLTPMLALLAATLRSKDLFEHFPMLAKRISNEAIEKDVILSKEAAEVLRQERP